jgi:hypothetical protein
VSHVKQVHQVDDSVERRQILTTQYDKTGNGGEVHVQQGDQGDGSAERKQILTSI